MKLAITSASFLNNKALVTECRNHFREWNIKSDVVRSRWNQPELINYLQDCDFAIIGKEAITAKTIAELPRLKAISKYGVGLDNIDAAAMSKRGIKLLHTPGVNCMAVAEHAIGLMLMLSRNLATSDRSMHIGKWNKDGGRSISECTIGIIGFGHIGQALAQGLNWFGCNILCHDILDQAELADGVGATQADLDEILYISDIITLHLPLTPKTHEMVDEQFLLKMKKDATLINTSRGEIIEEKALLAHLQKNSSFRAGLDVYLNEPYPCQKLITHPNVVATSHSAGNSQQAVLAMGRAAIHNLDHYRLAML